MKKIVPYRVTLALLLTFFINTGHTQTVFANLNSLLDYVKSKSITLQSGDINLLQAKQAKVAAAIAVTDPNINISGAFTNNIKLPVSVFPGEAFGGAAGTFKEVRAGVQYNTAFGQSLDIKLINPVAWQNIKLAAININMVQANNQISLKELYNNVATTYYNILQLQQQLASTKESLLAADTLLQITEHKYKQGLLKQQDVNESRVNKLNIEENARQIEFLINQNYTALKALADIPAGENISISSNELKNSAYQVLAVEQNNIAAKASLLKQQYSYENLKQVKRNSLPTLSFVAANNYNQYNPDFTLFGGKWINSQYIGLRLNFNLPNAASISNRSKTKFEYELAKKSTEKAIVQDANTCQQLQMDMDKAISQYKNQQQLLLLRQDTYSKNYTLYREGLISLDQTLTSFNNLVSSRYNLVTAHISILLANAKITINNSIK